MAHYLAGIALKSLFLFMQLTAFQWLIMHL